MKNHFFFPYTGNKRNEVGEIHDKIKNKLSGITTIIEPFCGSSAFSFYLSTLYPGRFKYILNDNNEHLVQLYHIAQSPEKFNKLVDELREVISSLNKEKYIQILNTGGLIGYILSNYIYCIRPGLFPISKNGHIKTIDAFIKAPIIHFLRHESVSISNIDAVSVYEKHMNNETDLIFLDPPYVMLNNDAYANTTFNIYEYLNEKSIQDSKAYIVLVLELSWIIKLLFKKEVPFMVTYEKQYQTSKKSTVHAIISNRNSI